MRRVGTSGRGSASASGRTVAVTASLVTLMTLAACSSSGQQGEAHSPAPGSSASGTSPQPDPSTSAPSKPAAGTAVITAAAVGGAKRANPAKPVVVTVRNGTLTSVKLVNGAGKVVSGTTSGDSSSWRTTEPLGYGKTYNLIASATDEGGKPTVKRAKITTVAPDNLTMPYFNTINGSAMVDGATYGVGMVVALHFDEAIPDRAAAEKAMQVTTTPKVTGAWYWTDDQNAHWRPQSYYQPGTKVTVEAKVYGVNLGDGLYGEDDQSTSFTAGQKRYAVADAKTHQVKVYFDDTLVRTMPTSMGRGGYVKGTDGPIGLWTPPGTYTVITHENPAIMRSDSYGLPTNSPDGYGRLVVPWSTKISTDGIYLHQLNSTVDDQGRRNVSHGCLNLNLANAKWFYTHTRVGDVVKVVHSGGPGLDIGRGGDWSVPWSRWVQGGAS